MRLKSEHSEVRGLGRYPNAFCWVQEICFETNTGQISVIETGRVGTISGHYRDSSAICPPEPSTAQLEIFASILVTMLIGYGMTMTTFVSGTYTEAVLDRITKVIYVLH